MARKRKPPRMALHIIFNGYQTQSCNIFMESCLTDRLSWQRNEASKNDFLHNIQCTANKELPIFMESYLTGRL